MALADRVGHLFDAIHPAQRGPFSYKEVADAIEAAGGPTISATYLWQLRKGLRDNPTKSHLEALARFFGVPVVYFFDDDAAAGIEEQLNLLAALRDAGVQQVALRAVGLSDRSLAAIQGMIEQARELEGLRDDRARSAVKASPVKVPAPPVARASTTAPTKASPVKASVASPAKAPLATPAKATKKPRKS